MSRLDTQVNMRIPQALKAQLEDAAIKNKRSITAELIHRLEGTFKSNTEWPSSPVPAEILEQISQAVAASLSKSEKDT